MDQIWSEQPVRKFNPIISLGTNVTGKTIGEKLVDIRADMKDKRCSVLVVTALDEVACMTALF